MPLRTKYMYICLYPCIQRDCFVNQCCTQLVLNIKLGRSRSGLEIELSQWQVVFLLKMSTGSLMISTAVNKYVVIINEDSYHVLLCYYKDTSRRVNDNFSFWALPVLAFIQFCSCVVMNHGLYWALFLLTVISFCYLLFP